MRIWLWAGLAIHAALTCCLSTANGQDAEDTSAIESAKSHAEELDLDRDGGVSFVELFHEPAPSADDELATNLFNSRKDWRQSLFRRADSDANQRLSWRELVRYEVMLAHWPLSPLEERRRVQQDFATRDADGNSQLSIEEWTAGAPGDAVSRLRRDFGVLDHNRDGHLTLEEYITYPDATRSPDFPVPDPWRNLLQTRKNAAIEVFTELDRSGDGHLSSDEWQESRWGESVPQLLPRQLSAWDLDKDQNVSRDEVERVLEFAYGFRHPDAPDVQTHTPRGAVLDTGWVLFMDEDRDGKISRKEFLSRYAGPPADRWRQFELADADGDGFASFTEAAAGHWFYHHSRHDFLTTDKNLDGVIDAAELSPPPREWERGVASRLLPGFDADGDQTLSLDEFLLTPVPNPIVAFWYTPRVDNDGDGHLNLQEFQQPIAIVGPLWLVGVVEEVFQRFDVDRDQRLSRREFTFTVNAKGLSADRQALFTADVDGDGKITFEDLFSEAPPAAENVALSEAYSARKDWIQRLFAQHDENHDAELSAREFARFETHRQRQPLSLELERAKLQQDFARRDPNGDGASSREEWLSNIPEEARPRATQEFVAADSDRSGALSFDEYLSLPETTQSADFPLPDPWRKILDDRLAVAKEIFSKVDIDSDGKLTDKEWDESIWQQVAPKLLSCKQSLWDLDHDRKVTWLEVERILEQAYGFQHPLAPGIRMRTARTKALDTGWIWFIDENHDSVISRQEFMSRYTTPEAERWRQFEFTDTDGNGTISFAEAVAAPWFYHPSRHDFFATDKNLDGAVDASELAPPPRAWEQAVAVRLVPGFDSDGDGLLQWNEFLLTPLASPVIDWYHPREDKNGDGKLGLSEFRVSAMIKDPVWLTGLCEEMFRRFDRDGDGYLSTDEYTFNVPYHRIPPLVAIGLLDVDKNGALSFEEVFREKRPDDAKSTAANDFEYRIMRAREAFVAADVDENEELGAREFARYNVYLLSESAADRATTSPVPLPQPEKRYGTLDWIWVGVMGFDVVLAGALGIYFVRRRSLRSVEGGLS